MGSAGFLVSSAKRAEGITEADSLEGTPVLSAYNRSPRSGWAVAIGIPRTSLTGNPWRSLGFNAAVTLALLALSVWMAKVISVRINRSIRSLHVPALALGTPELLSIPDNEIVEGNDVGQALMKASRMIRKHVEKHKKDILKTQEIMLKKKMTARNMLFIKTMTIQE